MQTKLKLKDGVLELECYGVNLGWFSSYDRQFIPTAKFNLTPNILQEIKQHEKDLFKRKQTTANILLNFYRCIVYADFV